MFGTAQRVGLGDSPLAEDMYSSIENEVLEQLFNATMNNDRNKEAKEEANQKDRKDENQTNDTSEETVEKKDNKNLLCDL
jgi:PAB1-binding protein PBP1